MQLSTQHLFEAMQWANTAHAGQTRWYLTNDGEVRDEPYANHLLRVCSTVTEHHGSIEAQIAAILHDIVEDTYVTIEEVRARYGDLVATYVEQLTLPPFADKNPKEKVRVQVKAMRETEFDEVRLIKIADKYDNVITLPECRWTEEAKIGYLTTAVFVVAVANNSAHRSMWVQQLAKCFFDMRERLLDAQGWRAQYIEAHRELYQYLLIETLKDQRKAEEKKAPPEPQTPGEFLEDALKKEGLGLYLLPHAQRDCRSKDDAERVMARLGITK